MITKKKEKEVGEKISSLFSKFLKDIQSVVKGTPYVIELKGLDKLTFIVSKKTRKD